jgi:hypothetical protein
LDILNKGFAYNGMVPDFLPYRSDAKHPVASAPIKALKCFCLFGLWPKIEASGLEGRGFPERNISIPDSFPQSRLKRRVCREAYRSSHPFRGWSLTSIMVLK